MKATGTSEVNHTRFLEREISLVQACVAITLFIVCGSVLIALTNAETSSSNALSPACQLSSILVPSCGVLWGAYVPNNSLSAIEGVMGRQFDVFSAYYDFTNGSSGQFPNAGDQTLIKGGRTLYAIWQSEDYATQTTVSWQQIVSGSEDLGVLIPEAQHLKSLGSTKIFVSFDPGMDDSSAYPASQYGSSSDYVAAYKHIYNVFQAQGVTNVIWVWSPTGNTTTESQQTAFYPGDNYVDWIGYGAFNSFQCGGTTTTWQSPYTTFDGFYSFIAGGGFGLGAERKPLVLDEYGSHDDAADPIKNDSDWYSQVQGALYSLPDIKAALEFDTAGSCDMTLTTSADVNGFKSSGLSSIVTGNTTSPAPSSTAELTPPTVSLLSPAPGTTVRGTITVTGTASDSIAVNGVELYLDDKLVATDLKPPYDFSLNSADYQDGTHVIFLVAYDASSNRAQTSGVPLIFNNGGAAVEVSSPTSVSFTLPKNGFSIDTHSSSSPIPVTGTLVIVPTIKGATLKVSVDGKVLAGTTVNTTKLTNGVHTLSITQNQTTKSFEIAVHNSLPINARNLAYTHPAVSAAGSIGLLVVILINVLLIRGWARRRIDAVSHYKLYHDLYR